MTGHQVIHTHPWLVLVSALSLAYLTTVLPLTFPLTRHGVVPAPEQQKLSILLHQYVLTWGLLVYTTSVLTLGGTYFVTLWNAVVLLGSVLACVEGMTGARGYEDEEIVKQRRYVRGNHYEAVSTGENGHQDAENGHQNADNDHQDVGEIEDTEPTENTPLIAQPTPTDEEQGAIGWWIAQLLVVVPLPVILVSHIAIILLFAMNQTLTDGTSPYAGEYSNGSHDVLTLSDVLRSLWSALDNDVIRCTPYCAIQFQHASLAEQHHLRHLRPIDTLHLSCIPIFTRVTTEGLFCPKRGPGHVARGHRTHWAESIPVECNYPPLPIRI